VPIPLPTPTRAPRAPRARRQDPDRPANSAWDVEYGRDIWRLRELGVADGTRAHISFEAIPQPWLKELAKRWARWRLVTGSGVATAATGTTAVSRFAMFLATVPVDRIDQLDRAVLKRYLAHLHATLAGRAVHRNMIGQLSVFFTAIRQHSWDPLLPAGVMVFPEDVPKDCESLPRAVVDGVTC
jgi:hypothetical protein